MITIKRYPNRKLYLEGKYINNSDIIRLVQEGKDVKVVARSLDGSLQDVTQYQLASALSGLLSTQPPEVIRGLINQYV